MRVAVRLMAVAACLAGPSGAGAQASDEEPATDGEQPARLDLSAPPLEDLVIRARPDDPDETELREEQLRMRLMRELEELRRIEEQQAWRDRIADDGDPDDRIRWGYDARAELEMRRETGIQDLPSETGKPATLFRARF